MWPALAFEPVTTALTRDAVVNWTDLRVEMTAIANPGSAQGTRATEEIARREVESQIDEALLRVAVDADRTIEDLRIVPELWTQIEGRARRWIETENRYYTSGRVGVVGAIELVSLLKPLTMSTATERPSRPSSPWTGVIVDTRGIEVKPCFAPTLRDPGRELYDGRLWLHAAAERASAVWVSDGAHPAANRAGDKPLLVHASSAVGCTLTVDPKDGKLIEEVVNAGVLGEGTLVVVVD